MVRTNIQNQLSEIKTLINTQAERPLNLEEACKYLSISKSYLYKLTCKNQIIFFKPNGKLIYFAKSDLDKWIFRNRQHSDSELEAQASSYVSRRKAGAR
jgi:excisionase family DNA binding protein